MSGRGAWAKLATFTPASSSTAMRSSESRASVRRLTPKLAEVRDFTSATAARNCSTVIVAEARIPSAPALAVAATSRGPATQPIPVCTMG